MPGYLCQSLLPSRKFSLTSRLVLGPPGLELVGQRLLPSLLCLSLVDVLHQDSLILEHITFHLHVHVVVHVLIDLLRVTIFPEKASEHAHPPQPQNFGRKPGLASTPPLTCKQRQKFPTQSTPLSNDAS